MEELRGEGINRERRVKSTPRERTSEHHICFCAAKNGPGSAFLVIISSGAKDKDTIWLSNCAARGSPSTVIFPQTQRLTGMGGECCLCPVALAAVWNLHVVRMDPTPPPPPSDPPRHHFTPTDSMSRLERSPRALSSAFAWTPPTHSAE